MQADHLLSSETRRALRILTGKAVCIQKDKALHRFKTSHSHSLFSIEDGEVFVQMAFDEYMLKDCDRSRGFLESQATLSFTDSNRNQKWLVLDCDTQVECIIQAWIQYKGSVLSHLEHMWRDTPYKSILYWGRLTQQISTNIEALRENFLTDFMDHDELALGREDVKSLCTVAKGPS